MAVLRNLRACVIKFLTFILKLLYYIGLYIIKYKEIYSCSIISAIIFFEETGFIDRQIDFVEWESELISGFNIGCSTVGFAFSQLCQLVSDRFKLVASVLKNLNNVCNIR
jgi:hypothetical protein